LQRLRVLGEHPVAVVAGLPRIVVHAMPLRDQAFNLNVQDIQLEALRPFGAADSWKRRFISEGVLSIQDDWKSEEAGYLFVGRDGIGELVHTGCSQQDTFHGERFINAREVVKMVSRGVHNILLGYAALGVSGPWGIAVSLLGATGFRLLVGKQESPINAERFATDRLLCEPVELREQIELSGMCLALRPVFDQIWQSVGWDCCRDFDANAYKHEGEV